MFESTELLYYVVKASQDLFTWTRLKSGKFMRVGLVCPKLGHQRCVKLFEIIFFLLFMSKLFIWIKQKLNNLVILVDFCEFSMIFHFRNRFIKKIQTWEAEMKRIQIQNTIFYNFKGLYTFHIIQVIC